MYPCRIELFGDEIDSIRTFNIESQRSIENIDKIEIFPAKEIIIDEEAKKRALQEIESELKNSLSKEKDQNRKERLNRTVKKNVEELREFGSFQMVESYLPFFYEEANSLFDYLKNYIVILDEKERAIGKLNSVYEEFNQNYTMLLEEAMYCPGN